MNPSDASKYFTLKWNYLPNSADYLLQAGQLYNHMKNSHELTSKSYLSKNLRNAQIPHLDTFFPKCFDLSIASERCELAEEYTYGFMM